eukprot:12627429-Alexandrium_andersonii.AAC.1
MEPRKKLWPALTPCTPFTWWRDTSPVATTPRPCPPPQAMVSLRCWSRGHRKMALAIVSHILRFNGCSAWRVSAFSLSVGRLSVHSLR